MAMFEMATSFNSQQLQFPLPPDAYSGSAAQQADRDLLQLFSQDDLLNTLGDSGNPWSGDDLCKQLACRFKFNAQQNCAGSNSYDEDLFKDSPLQRNDYLPSTQSRSNAVNLRGSCALAAGSHRILAVPNPNFDPVDKDDDPYLLYSCLTTPERQQCLFETWN